MMIRLMMAFALVAATAVPATGQTAGTTNMEILRDKLKADKKLVVAENLTLTDAENAAFWPVYEAYQKDLQQINQRMTTAIRGYADAYNKGPVSDEDGEKASRRSAGHRGCRSDAETLGDRRRFSRCSRPTKAARYIQMESKIRAVVRYELAANIPLVK